MNYRLWLTIGLALWNAPALGQCVQRQVVRRAAKQQFVEVPFAIATSVPVAEAAPFFYSYNYAPQEYQAQQGDDVLAKKIADEVVAQIAVQLGIKPQVQPQRQPPAQQQWDRQAEAPRWEPQDEQQPYRPLEAPPQPQAPSGDWNGRSVPSDAGGESIVAVKCAGCHGHGEQSSEIALSKIDLSDLSALTDAERLASIRAVHTAKMPKHPSPRLSLAEINFVVRELTK